MNLIPEENCELKEKVKEFQSELEIEYNTNGWEHISDKTTKLYKENLLLECELDKKCNEIHEYQKIISRLKYNLENKSSKINYDPLQDISTPDILTPKISTPDIIRTDILTPK
tara:strand:+ start:534 stop:872 length:339 start_codon:yes stop_codon:yes gene_type:complete